MALCKLCGENRPLVKAHVQPESFFRALAATDSSGPPLIVSNRQGAPTKRSPIGVYDSTILCAACEARFGPWDDYAARVLINELDAELRPLSANGEILAFLRPSFDYEKLKLFFISVLWRAAVSSMPYFASVRLGPHEEMTRLAVLRADPGSPHHFSVVLARRIASPAMEGFAASMISPFREKLDGINVVRMYFGRVIAYLKVDQQPFRSPFDEVMLAPNRLLMLAQEFDGGKDLHAMREIVRMNSGR
jgi:hypothetical protein